MVPRTIFHGDLSDSRKIVRGTIFSRGFTLIEVLVVVAILGILAAIVVPRIMDRPDEAKRVAAKADISAIVQALKLYRLDNGNYPTTDQGLFALVQKPTSQPLPPNWKQGGYLDKLPRDPWGSDYQYLSPGNAEAARREGATVALAIERARDDAWFGGRPTAISFADGRLREWRWSADRWEGDPSRDQALGAARVTALFVDGAALKPDERLVFLPDGLGIPFRVALDVRGFPWAVEGDAAGAVTLVER